MYRILFTIGSFHIYSYGVMIALAFIIGVFLAMKEAKRIGENPERVLDISLYGEENRSQDSGARSQNKIIYSM